MRIAQIMLAKGFGGAERSFVDLSRALADRGHHILALGERRARALEMLASHPNIECRAIHCMGSWDRLAGLAIQRQLAQFAPQVVQAHLARAAHLGGRAARALGVPTLAKTHTLVNLAYYRSIDMLVPTTMAQANYLRAHGVPTNAISRIPNFSPVAAVAGISSASASHPIKALGRFVHKKGFDSLLHALAAVVAAGFDVRLVIGGDGPERAALARLASVLQLEERVSLPGWVEDVPAFLADARLFVLPSREEPFGIVLLEAMARGIPIVTTPTQGPLEILNGAAWFSEGDDAAALGGVIVRALSDRITTLDYARTALQRFNDEFSTGPVIARYLELYGRLIADQAIRRQP